MLSLPLYLSDSNLVSSHQLCGQICQYAVLRVILLQYYRSSRTSGYFHREVGLFDYSPHKPFLYFSRSINLQPARYARLASNPIFYINVLQTTSIRSPDHIPESLIVRIVLGSVRVRCLRTISLLRCTHTSVMLC